MRNTYRKLMLWWMGYLLILTSPRKCNSLKKRACVIGAGATGLVSIKQLSDHLSEFEPIVFEKNSDVGGLWIYSDYIGDDQFGLPVHSSMYSNLRANLPTELMEFPDYKMFTDENRSCVRSELVLQYLRNFTSNFDLRQYIRFNTLVEKVLPLPKQDDKGSQWLVSTRTAKTNENNEVVCDAVIVCNGHYFKQYIPKIPGIETFPGKILHSHLYRKAEEFTDRTVVLLGAAVSGRDIAITLSKYAKTIYVSHRHDKLSGEQPSNVIQVAGVVSANGSELTLQDGSKITADAFIYCTGYLKDYPFLDESSGIKLTNGDRDVEPLYKYVVNIEQPSMAFIGVARGFINFPQYFLQAQYYVAILQGKVQLPNRTEMLEKMKSRPETIYDIEWILYDEYAKEANGTHLPNYSEPAVKLWARLIAAEKFYYKEYNLRVLDDGRVELYKPERSNEFSINYDFLN